MWTSDNRSVLLRYYYTMKQCPVSKNTNITIIRENKKAFGLVQKNTVLLQTNGMRW